MGARPHHAFPRRYAVDAHIKEAAPDQPPHERHNGKGPQQNLLDFVFKHSATTDKPVGAVKQILWTRDEWSGIWFQNFYRVWEK